MIDHIKTRGEKVYGEVRRGGKLFYRKYKRPIKNGLTMLDLLDRKTNKLKELINQFSGITQQMRGGHGRN